MKKATIGTMTVVCSILSLTAGCGSSDPSTVTEGCKPAHEFKTIKKGVLTVAAYDAAPYIGIVDGKPTQADGEVLQAIAKMECLDIKAVPLQIAAIIPALTSGRVDVASGDWWRTVSREKEALMTDPIYADAMSIVTKDGITSLSDLEGKRVGSVQGNIWNDEMEKVIGKGFKTYQNHNGVFTDFKNGRLDAVIDSGASAPVQLKLAGVEGKVDVPPADSRVAVTERPVLNTFPIRKGNEAMRDAFNADLDKLRESGELKRILDRLNFAPELQDVKKPYYVLPL